MITTVNGKTNDVTLNASDVKTNASSSKTVEEALTSGGYVSSVSKISGTEDDYVLTITKKT